MGVPFQSPGHPGGQSQPLLFSCRYFPVDLVHTDLSCSAPSPVRSLPAASSRGGQSHPSLGLVWCSGTRQVTGHGLPRAQPPPHHPAASPGASRSANPAGGFPTKCGPLLRFRPFRAGFQAPSRCQGHSWSWGERSLPGLVLGASSGPSTPWAVLGSARGLLELGLSCPEL